MKENNIHTLCVCPRCADIWTDKDVCPFCGCTMIRTKYTQDDEYAAFETGVESDQFDNKIRTEYVYGNPLYSDAEYQRRLKQEDEEFYSSSSSVPRCPNCGSTAITTGQRGYSVIYGFAGSSRTVNRCGNCGYKWEP